MAKVRILIEGMIHNDNSLLKCLSSWAVMMKV